MLWNLRSRKYTIPLRTNSLAKNKFAMFIYLLSTCAQRRRTMRRFPFLGATTVQVEFKGLRAEGPAIPEEIVSETRDRKDVGRRISHMYKY